MGNKQQKNKKSKQNNIKYVEKEIKDTPGGNSNNNIENNAYNTPNNDTIDKIDKYICKYYIKFIGSSGVGSKTSLIKRIIEGKFVEVTKGNNEINEMIYEKDNKEFILYLIDGDGVIKDIIVFID